MVGSHTGSVHGSQPSVRGGLQVRSCFKNSIMSFPASSFKVTISTCDISMPPVLVPWVAGLSLFRSSLCLSCLPLALLVTGQPSSVSYASLGFLSPYNSLTNTYNNIPTLFNYPLLDTCKYRDLEPLKIGTVQVFPFALAKDRGGDKRCTRAEESKQLKKTCRKMVRGLRRV